MAVITTTTATKTMAVIPMTAIKALKAKAVEAVVRHGNIVNTALDTKPVGAKMPSNKPSKPNVPPEPRRKALEARRATEEARRANTPPATQTRLSRTAKPLCQSVRDAATAKKVPWGCGYRWNPSCEWNWCGPLVLEPLQTNPKRRKRCVIGL